MLATQLPKKLESLEDAKQAFDAIHRFLYDRGVNDRWVNEAIGHAADGGWCLVRGANGQRSEE